MTNVSQISRRRRGFEFHKQRGIEIHESIEHRIRTGKVLDNEWAACVLSVDHLLPDEHQVLCNESNRSYYHEPEYDFVIQDPTGRGLSGRMDLIFPLRREVFEWKTTTKDYDTKHMRDRALEENAVQAVAYLKALTEHSLFDYDDEDYYKEYYVRLNLVYIRVGKRPKSTLIQIDLDSDILDSLWGDLVSSGRLPQ
jgi:hypothetical protein